MGDYEKQWRRAGIIMSKENKDLWDIVDMIASLYPVWAPKVTFSASPIFVNSIEFTAVWEDTRNSYVIGRNEFESFRMTDDQIAKFLYDKLTQRIKTNEK